MSPADWTEHDALDELAESFGLAAPSKQTEYAGPRRGSGKTTKSLLVAALLLRQGHTVVFVAQRRSVLLMLRDVRTWLSRAGLQVQERESTIWVVKQPGRLRFLTAEQVLPERLAGHANPVVVDHLAWRDLSGWKLDVLRHVARAHGGIVAITGNGDGRA